MNASKLSRHVEHIRALSPLSTNALASNSPVFTESIQAARSSTLCPTGLVVLRSESPATQHGFSQPACAHVLPSATEPLLVAPQTPSRSRLRDPSSAPAPAPASIRPIGAWQNAPVCCRRPQCSARARVTFSSLAQDQIHATDNSCTPERNVWEADRRSERKSHHVHVRRRL